MPDRKLSTRAEAIGALGLPSSRALDKLIERGAPPPAAGKPGSPRYDVAAIEQWRRARQAKTKPTIDLTLERAKLAKTQRRLYELKIRGIRQVLIPQKDATAGATAIIGAVKTQLLSVSRQAVMAGLPREHEGLIRRLIVEALRDLSELRTVQSLVAKTDPDAMKDAE